MVPPLQVVWFLMSLVSNFINTIASRHSALEGLSSTQFFHVNWAPIISQTLGGALEE